VFDCHGLSSQKKGDYNREGDAGDHAPQKIHSSGVGCGMGLGCRLQ
jgi:hypothetical protein